MASGPTQRWRCCPALSHRNHSIRANTTHWNNVGLMLAQHQPNIAPMFLVCRDAVFFLGLSQQLGWLSWLLACHSGRLQGGAAYACRQKRLTARQPSRRRSVPIGSRTIGVCFGDPVTEAFLGSGLPSSHGPRISHHTRTSVMDDEAGGWLLCTHGSWQKTTRPLSVWISKTQCLFYLRLSLLLQ